MASTAQTGSLQDQAQDVLNQTKESARAVAGEQQRAAAGGLSQFASALRKAAREMNDGGQPPQVARIAESAADGLERFSGSLREKDLNRLVGDVSRSRAASRSHSSAPPWLQDFLRCAF